MIDFHKLRPEQRDEYNRILFACGERGCEYSFANLCLWGRQKAAFLDGFAVLFSQFERRSVYPYPIGAGDVKPILDAIILDARERGIVCRLSGLTAADCVTLEELYPGKFRFHPDRDSCDYVYKIENLATLSGKKLQKKRNHVNKFRAAYPDCRIRPLDAQTLPAAREMAEDWYTLRLQEDPNGDFHLEQQALGRAFDRMAELHMEGLALMDGERCIAMTMGSALSDDTFDIHFEKALASYDGAGAAVNQAFAAYLRDKFPQLRYLNREEDMGLPGLRKAKLSYHPDHLVVKFWARLWEDDDED